MADSGLSLIAAELMRRLPSWNLLSAQRSASRQATERSMTILEAVAFGAMLAWTLATAAAAPWPRPTATARASRCRAPRWKQDDRHSFGMDRLDIGIRDVQSGRITHSFA